MPQSSYQQNLSSTWQNRTQLKRSIHTSCCYHAPVEFNSFHLVGHGSSTTYELGLMGHKLRDNMPSINEEKLSDRYLVTERLKQKEYHDRKKASERKIPNDFQINQRVAIQHHQDKT